MIKEIYDSARQPQEVSALLKLKFSKKYKTNIIDHQDLFLSDDYKFCYDILKAVSRSFAVVIQQLPPEIKDATCLFYLILRGLDTVEDDMSLVKEQKIELLQNFYKKLENKHWNISDIGDTEHYRNLLTQFDKVIRIYHKLDKKYQYTISETCKKMGHGMAEFYDSKIITKKQYDLYCHYVAGLVGQGLSALFVSSGLEDDTLHTMNNLSNSMGLMLQKTNITRDYFEDIPQNRIFWPQEIWKKYETDITAFAGKNEDASSIAALNEMVVDAIKHLPDVIQYLSLIQNKQIFRFCAIPQIMAISTLSKIYNNPKTFIENVKIRKGLAAKYMVHTNDFTTFCAYTFNCISDIQVSLLHTDPNYETIQSIKEEVNNALQHHLTPVTNSYYYG